MSTDALARYFEQMDASLICNSTHLCHATRRALVPPASGRGSDLLDLVTTDRYDLVLSGEPAIYPPLAQALTFVDSIAMRQHRIVIRSFKNSDTEKVWNREHVPALGSGLQRAGQKKLRLLNAATELNSLRVPPGNRLEKLVGDRAGQCSIRINDQYRICFVWTDNGADDVEITDYH